jgi:hypothetical protein
MDLSGLKSVCLGRKLDVLLQIRNPRRDSVKQSAPPTIPYFPGGIWPPLARLAPPVLWMAIFITASEPTFPVYCYRQA